MSKEDFLALVENTYKITEIGEYNYMSELFTPIDLLALTKRYAEALLLQSNNTPIKIKLIQNKSNYFYNETQGIYFEKN